MNFSERNVLKSVYRSKTPDFDSSLRKLNKTMDGQDRLQSSIGKFAEKSRAQMKIISKLLSTQNNYQTDLSILTSDSNTDYTFNQNSAKILIPENPLKIISSFTPTKFKISTREKSSTPKVVYNENDAGKRLGPGSYNSPSQKSGPSFQFSSTPRPFVQTKEHILSSIQSRFISTERKKEADEKIKKLVEKNLSQYSPKNKKEILQKKAKEKNIQECLTKQTKNNIVECIHEHRERQLEEKFRKYEQRIHRKEFIALQKNWSFLIINLGVLSILKVQLRKRRIVKRKIALYIKRLWGFSRALGKFLQSLKRVRKSKTHDKLRIIFTPFLRRWVEKKRYEKGSVILDLIDRVLTARSLPISARKWKLKMNFLKRTMKSLAKIYLSRVRVLKKQWDKIDMDDRNKSFITESKDNVIPEIIKTIYVKQYLKKKLKAYARAMIKHKQLCKEMEIELAMQRNFKEIEQALTGKKVDMSDVMPKRPVFLLYSFPNELKDIMKAAENNRKNWHLILGVDPSFFKENKTNIRDGHKKHKKPRDPGRKRSSSSNSAISSSLANFSGKKAIQKAETQIPVAEKSGKNSRDQKRSSVKFARTVTYRYEEPTNSSQLAEIPEVRARSRTRR
ncbi:unnamed protein product [Blepharisma stoltei]|uniref:IQ calmodulin-binding motif family protein n=1 Tax=Blepharisma stoltei TaxID=1481888 RepID=A0AAU9I8V6_9CILI|nr:unnamed protein product [Blepharisma stoltei]